MFHFPDSSSSSLDSIEADLFDVAELPFTRDSNNIATRPILRNLSKFLKEKRE